MIDEDQLNALELFGENEYLHKEIERLNNIIKQQDTRNSRQRIANRKLLERNQDLVIENLKLNNIIKAIEKALKDNIEELKDLTFSYDRIYEDKEILKLIQELKGSDKDE